jgi:hypothetical protein
MGFNWAFKGLIILIVRENVMAGFYKTGCSENEIFVFLNKCFKGNKD